MVDISGIPALDLEVPGAKAADFGAALRARFADGIALSATPVYFLCGVDPSGLLVKVNSAITTALFPTIENDIRPSVHCSRWLNKTQVRVVIIGDSLTTFVATENGNRENGFSPQLTRWLKSQFPEKKFDFYYRGIGGKRYFDLNTIIADYPSNSEWTPSPVEKWSATVAGLAPDLVIFAFGMNDGGLWSAGNFQPDDMLQAISDIRKAMSRPDVWFCTNLKPSTSTDNVNFNTEAQQEGRDAVAGYTRSFAKTFGFGLLDFNRWMNIARDGRDVCDRYFYDEGTLTQTIPLFSTNKCRDFQAIITVENIPSDFFNPASSGVKLQMRMSPENKSLLHISERNGLLEFEIYSDTLSGIYTRRLTGVAAPTTGGIFTMGISLVGEDLILKLQGTEVFNGKIVRHGGVFQPYFMYSDNRAGPAATWQFYRGVDLPAAPSLQDESLWSGTGIGGNGLNHPNAIACGQLYSPVLSRISARGVADHSALIMLKGHDGIALDGASGQYALVKAGVITTGTVDSIVSAWIGGITELPAYIESGIRTGFRLAAGKGAVIDLASLWGSSISNMVFATDAKTLTPATATYFSAIATVANLGPRVQFASTSSGILNPACVDDTSTVTAQFNFKNASIFTAGAVAVNANCFVGYADGRYIATDLLCAIPTALTTLKLGHVDLSGNAGDAVISKVILIPGAENFAVAQSLCI